MLFQIWAGGMVDGVVDEKQGPCFFGLVEGGVGGAAAPAGTPGAVTVGGFAGVCLQLASDSARCSSSHIVRRAPICAAIC